MKAVILSAGLSSRLSGGVPKSLLFLSGGTTIIGRTISQLDSLGFSTMVVVGYRAPFFLSTLSTDVSFAYNPIYASTSSIYSLKIAMDLLREDPLLVVWADQITNIEDIERLIQTPNSILITPLTPEYNAEYALQVEENVVTGVTPFKKFPKCGREYWGYGGFAFLDKKILDRVHRLPAKALAHQDLPIIFEGCHTVVGDCSNINDPISLIEVQRKLEEIGAYQR